MLENQDFLGGITRFSPNLLILNLLLAIGFIFLWAKEYKKTGWMINYYIFHFFLLFFVPVFLMYPFSASELNIISVGQKYGAIEAHVNNSYLITSAGIIFFLIGKSIYSITGNLNILSLPAIAVKPIDLLIYKNIKQPHALRILSFFVLALLLSLIIVQFSSGYVGDPRGFFMENNIYRPIYNFISSIYGIVSTFLAIRFIQYKEKKDLYLFITLAIFSIGIGTRSAVLSSIVTMGLFYIFKNNGQFRPGRVIFFVLIAVVFSLYMEGIRHGIFDFIVVMQGGLANIFYGNNFSDIRDFAWILAYWDGSYLLGKSYIAGLMAFIPSTLSDFREIWSISRYTNEIVGFDSSIHAGLRPGTFGEAYFNFGITGVMLIGLIGGFTLESSSAKIMDAIKLNDDIVLAYSKSFSYIFISNFFITAGFFSLYVFVFSLSVMWALNKFISLQISTKQENE